MTTTNMKPHMATARLVGALFLVSTAPYLLGTSLVESLLIAVAEIAFLLWLLVRGSTSSSGTDARRHLREL
jgi:hypothetical protein